MPTLAPLRLLFAVLLTASGVTSAAGGVTEVMTADLALKRWPAEGMTSIRVDGLDILYVNPSAKLDGYRKVLLKPVSVEPNLDWRRKYFVPGSTWTLNLRPMIESTQTRARAAVSDALTRGGYELTDQPAADVIEVNASIVDIFLIAVKTGGGRIEKAEGDSLGSAALVADIRDSVSGDLILRVFDRDRAPKPRLPARRAGEEAEAWLNSAVDGWAALLPKALDVSNRQRKQ
ncbi:MAG: hypothetical protein ABIR16_04260 [Dokdonella sp.]